MPLEPYHLKACWNGAKRIGWRWMLWAGVAAAVPVLVVLPVVVLVGAAIGDAAILAASMIQKTREANRLAAEEQRKTEAAERLQIKERERRERLQRERPPEPTIAEKFTAAKKRHDDTRRELEAAGLDPVMLGAALRKVKMRYLNELDGLL